jgi:hypothetical protein
VFATLGAAFVANESEVQEKGCEVDAERKTQICAGDIKLEPAHCVNYRPGNWVGPTWVSQGFVCLSIRFFGISHKPQSHVTAS